MFFLYKLFGFIFEKIYFFFFSKELLINDIFIVIFAECDAGETNYSTEIGLIEFEITGGANEVADFNVVQEEGRWR